MNIQIQRATLDNDLNEDAYPYKNEFPENPPTTCNDIVERSQGDRQNLAKWSYSDLLSNSMRCAYRRLIVDANVHYAIYAVSR